MKVEPVREYLSVDCSHSALCWSQQYEDSIGQSFVSVRTLHAVGPASQSDGKPSVEKESTQSAASSSQSQSKPPSQAGRPPLGERRAVQLEEGKSTTPRAAASEAASIPNGHASSKSH